MTKIDEINKLLILSIDVVSKAADLCKSFKSSEKKIVDIVEDTRELKIIDDSILEEFLVTRLGKAGFDILSEEGGEIRGSNRSEFRFIIDPLDGSYNFHREIGPCAISVALWENELPIFGVIYSILDDCLIWGGKDLGVHTSIGGKLRVSNKKDLNQSVLYTGFPARASIDDHYFKDQFWRFAGAFSKIRMIGSAAISLLSVASGRSECYRETGIMVWDVAAGLALVQGAGGVVQFKFLPQQHSMDVLATNKVLASELQLVE